MKKRADSNEWHGEIKLEKGHLGVADSTLEAQKTAPPGREVSPG